MKQSTCLNSEMLCPINWNGLLCSEIVVCFAEYIRVMTRCTSWIWRNLFDLQQQWKSLLSPLCPSTLGSGRHKPFIPRRGSRRVSGLLHTFQRLLRRQKKELSQETWQVILLWVCLSHTGKSHPQVTHGAGKKLITCFETEHPCFSSSSQYVSKHNAKCLPWSRKS